MFDVNKIIGNKKKNTSIINKFGLKAFGGKRDWDGDGIKNKKDCQPFNTMRQDTYMFLSKQKQNRNELPAKAYVYPKQYVQPKRIFLTKDTPKTVEGVSETLAHEEMHHAIAGVSDWDASKQWDYYESKLESNTFRFFSNSIKHRYESIKLEE